MYNLRQHELIFICRRLNTSATTHTLHCPQLLHAKFHGIWAPISSNRLTHLHLQMNGMGTSRPKIEQLCDYLFRPNCGTLTHLYVQSAIRDDASDADPPKTEPISFPNLRELEFCGTAYEYLRFHRHLSLPTTVQIVNLSITDGVTHKRVDRIMTSIGM